MLFLLTAFALESNCKSTNNNPTSKKIFSPSPASYLDPYLRHRPFHLRNIVLFAVSLPSRQPFKMLPLYHLSTLPLRKFSINNYQFSISPPSPSKNFQLTTINYRFSLYPPQKNFQLSTINFQFPLPSSAPSRRSDSPQPQLFCRISAFCFRYFRIYY